MEVERAEPFMCPSCENYMNPPTKIRNSTCRVCGHLETKIIDPHPMWLLIICGLVFGLPLFFTHKLVQWFYWKFNSVNNFFHNKFKRYERWANKGNRNYDG